MPRGTYTAMSVESTPGVIMGNRCRCSLGPIELQERWSRHRQGPHRGYCKLSEERYIIERPPPWVGAERETSENKTMVDTDLKWWIYPGRYSGTLVRLYRKKD